VYYEAARDVAQHRISAFYEAVNNDLLFLNTQPAWVELDILKQLSGCLNYLKDSQ